MCRGKLTIEIIKFELHKLVGTKKHFFILIHSSFIIRVDLNFSFHPRRFRVGLDFNNNWLLMRLIVPQ